MTKLESQKQFVINGFGKTFQADKWGHFTTNNYRIKIQKTNFRFERKSGQRWVRTKSVYFKDVDNNLIDFYINIMLNKL